MPCMLQEQKPDDTILNKYGSVSGLETLIRICKTLTMISYKNFCI